jgi:hypothetical protein
MESTKGADMKAISIHLYRDDREEDYCGSWHVPCPDDDPRVADLEAANCGRFLGDDGVPGRAFFFADEIGEMLERAERETGCVAVALTREGDEVFV